MRMTAVDQLELGVIDGIIDEVPDGAHADHAATAASIKAAILGAFAEIGDAGPDMLLANRYARLRRTGDYRESEVPGGESAERGWCVLEVLGRVDQDSDKAVTLGSFTDEINR